MTHGDRDHRKQSQRVGRRQKREEANHTPVGLGDFRLRGGGRCAANIDGVAAVKGYREADGHNEPHQRWNDHNHCQVLQSRYSRHHKVAEYDLGSREMTGGVTLAQVGATLVETDTVNVVPQREYIPTERRAAAGSGFQARADRSITAQGGP